MHAWRLRLTQQKPFSSTCQWPVCFTGICSDMRPEMGMPLAAKVCLDLSESALVV